MFNLSGTELIFLILIALVVLGPDKLPEAMRKAGKAYADFKRMTSGFQSEMKSVLDEPMRELRETAELAKKAAMFDTNMFDTSPIGSSSKSSAGTKPVSGSMAAQTPVATAAETSATSALAAEAVAAKAAAADATSRRLANSDIKSAVVASGTMTGSGQAPAEPAEPVEPAADAAPVTAASVQQTDTSAVGAHTPAHDTAEADTDEIPVE